MTWQLMPSVSAATKSTKQSLSTAISGHADGRAVFQKVAVMLCHNLVDAPRHQQSLVRALAFELPTACQTSQVQRSKINPC